MTILKCKMCGGDLEITPGMSVAECLYCGAQQTILTSDDEGIQNLFNRANILRMKSEFDKAADIYEKILQRNENEAEAYWGLILCKYGIEYVEDPATFKRVPTCHRASYDAVTADEDYKNALKYADMMQKHIYEQEAKIIDEIQKGIIALAQKEEPYDVFICYKESDDFGKRTQDSVIANDIYHHLTQEGFKVFYAAISLEDKLGKEYEPYIFSALNTAKVMLSLGTRPEYFNAVWVKNEWSRFLKIMKKDRNKLLIPCYKDMDPYELPEEFAHLQAQDMGKIGFINDIVRGIKKVITKEEQKTPVKETVVVQQSTGSTTANAQVQRGNMALEDHEWAKADDFFEEALNLDPQCAEAYLGKMLARDKMPEFASWVTMQKEKYSTYTTEKLTACSQDIRHIDQIVRKMVLEDYLDGETIRAKYKFDREYGSSLSCRRNQKNKQQTELNADRLLTRAQQYASGSTKKMIEDGIAEIMAVLDQRIAMAEEQDQASIIRVTNAYRKHIDSADKIVQQLNADAHACRDQKYQDAVVKMKNANDISSYEQAREALKAMKGYLDSNELAAKCQKEIDRLKEEKRLEEERQAAIRKQEQEKAAKKKKKITTVIAAVAVACIATVVVYTKVIVPNNNYNAAKALMESGEYEAAIDAFKAMDGYKDSAEQIEKYYIGKYGEETYNLIKSIKAGDEYTFGTYEQDNNSSNGKEDIEWLVLEKEGSRILVTSKYALDCQQYNTKKESVTWETCSLRGWLNDSFLNDAFDADEKAKIIEAAVTADKNPEYSTNPGNDTKDKVYLLSITEAEKYFANDESRKCVPTKYAIAQGAYTSNSNSVGGKATCWWWLRSPGGTGSDAARVNRGGSLDYIGLPVDYVDNCVRPALWIDLAS